MALIRRNMMQRRLLAVTLCVVALCAYVGLLRINGYVDFVENKPAELNKDSTRKSATRSNQPRADGPKVTFLVAQTSPTEGWCRTLVSSIFSNVTVVTIGAGRTYRHTYRPLWLMEYVEAEKLRDEDVVVMVDGADNLFTGVLPVQKALQKFIAATAPTADAFDSASVRRGETLVPMLFPADLNCYTPEARRLVPKGSRYLTEHCEELFAEARRRAGMENELSDNPADPGRSPARYLNGGGIMARVWALKQATAAYRALLRSKRGLWCDQSVWTVLYIWSLTNESSVPPAMVLPFGLIGIDYHFNFMLCMYPEHMEIRFLPWNESAVREVVAAGDVPLPRFFDILGHPNATPLSLHIFGFFQEVQGNLQKTIPYLPWFREVHRDNRTLQRAKQRLAEDTFVDMRESAGTQRLVRFADVCPVKNVLDMQWLTAVQRKEKSFLNRITLNIF